MVNTSGNYEDRHCAVILTESGKKNVLNFPNPDAFLVYLQDIQNKQGLIGTDHVPLKLESRVDFKTNMEAFLDSGTKILQALTLAVSIAGIRHVAKSMKNSVSSRCRLSFKQP